MSTRETKADARPVDPQTGRQIGPLVQPGYYPGFSTLSQKNFWDAKTREVVLDRVHNIPEIRFFTPAETRLLEAVCDHILPQDDRTESRRIPIVPQIDKRLYEQSHDGYRYEGMPPDREAFRLGLQAIDEIAKHEHGSAFADLGIAEQDQILCRTPRWQTVGRTRDLGEDAYPPLLDVTGFRLRGSILRASMGVG